MTLKSFYQTLHQIDHKSKSYMEMLQTFKIPHTLNFPFFFSPHWTGPDEGYSDGRLAGYVADFVT